jgi:elongation factor P
MYSTTDFRKGLKIEMDGEPYIIVECQHVKPGKGAAMVKTRVKSLISGNVQDINFRSGDKVDEPNLEDKAMQYLYSEGDDFHFMDQNTYDQVMITRDQLGDAADYLQENCEVKALYHNDKPIGVDLPIFVELRIVKSEPGVRGDTATGVTKAATLETGKVIQVPLFVNQGEVVKVDTRTGEYVERVKE